MSANKKINYGYLLGGKEEAVYPSVNYSHLLYGQNTTGNPQSSANGAVAGASYGRSAVMPAVSGGGGVNYGALLNGNTVSEGGGISYTRELVGGSTVVPASAGIGGSGSKVIRTSGDIGGGEGGGAGGGSSEGGGGSTFVPVSSEEGIYSQLYKHYEDYYTQQEEAARKQKEESERAAEQNYQNAVADSQAAYRRNLLGYGTKGEELSRMGLTGSGYSDYLTGKAMELQRKETQAAGAEKNAAMSAASNLYTQTLLNANTEVAKGKYSILEKQLQDFKDNKINKNTVLAGILDFAREGKTDIDTLKRIAAESGVVFDETTWAAVEAEIANAKTTNADAKIEAFKQALFEGNDPIIDNFNPYNAADVNKLYTLAEAYGVDTNSDAFIDIAKRMGVAVVKDEKVDTEPGGNGGGVTEEGGEAVQPTGQNIAYDENGKFIQATYKGTNSEGNYVYDYNGKEIVVNPLTNPYTLTTNADVQYGVFSKTPYQPNNINGEKLEKTGDFDYVNGVRQNVWKTPDGQLWLWDGTKNEYIPRSENPLSAESLREVQARDAHYDVHSNNLEDMAKRYDYGSSNNLYNTSGVNKSGGYLYSSASAKISSFGEGGDGVDFNLNINGEDHKLELGLEVDKMNRRGMIELLDNIVLSTKGSARSKYDSCVVSGDLFVFDGEVWRTTSSGFTGSKEDYRNAVKAYIGLCETKNSSVIERNNQRK